MERDGPGSPLSALTNPGSSLFQRIAAILVLAPVALAIIWFGGRPFSALIAFICILLVFEWARIVDRVEFSNAFYLLSFTAILSIFLTAGGDYRDAFLVSLGGGVFGAILEKLSNRRFGWPLVGAIYLIIPCNALIWIRAIPEQGLGLTLILFTTVWANDICAYIIGKSVGGPRLLPSVSPGKTWAGTLGGIACAIIACLLLWATGIFSITGGPAMSALAITGVAFGLSVISVIGDLAESALKRYFGVKDSGGYIPGHGGILDRLDGMIFATAAMALVLFVYSAA